MTTTCKHCGMEFTDVDRDEDGSPDIPGVECSDPFCEQFLCEGGCLDLSFECECCGERFCNEHRLMLDGDPVCATCLEDCAEVA